MLLLLFAGSALPASTIAQGAGGAPRLHAKINGQSVVGTRRQIEDLLRRLAQQHAEEDEQRIERSEPAKKRAVRVVASGKVITEPTKAAPSVTVAAPVLREAGITADAAAAVYQRAYAAHMQREAIRQDDEDVAAAVGVLRKQRIAVVESLMAQIENIRKALLQ